MSLKVRQQGGGAANGRVEGWANRGGGSGVLACVSSQVLYLVVAAAGRT
jgi:hypothetical protein